MVDATVSEGCKLQVSHRSEMWVQVLGVDLGRDASLRLELLQIWCVLENFVSTVWAREAGIVAELFR